MQACAVHLRDRSPKALRRLRECLIPNTFLTACHSYR